MIVIGDQGGKIFFIGDIFGVYNTTTPIQFSRRAPYSQIVLPLMRLLDYAHAGSRMALKFIAIPKGQRKPLLGINGYDPDTPDYCFTSRRRGHGLISDPALRIVNVSVSNPPSNYAIGNWIRHSQGCSPATVADDVREARNQSLKVAPNAASVAFPIPDSPAIPPMGSGVTRPIRTVSNAGEYAKESNPERTQDASTTAERTELEKLRAEVENLGVEFSASIKTLSGTLIARLEAPRTDDTSGTDQTGSAAEGDASKLCAGCKISLFPRHRPSTTAGRLAVVHGNAKKKKEKNEKEKLKIPSQLVPRLGAASAASRPAAAAAAAVS